MDVESFKKSLLNDDVDQIYNEYILGSNVWYFQQGAKSNDHYATYDKFRRYLAQKLGIHMNNVAVVGSAKLGFSLSPKKAYRAFNSSSDIDVVIVSSEVFRQSWDAFLDLKSKYFLQGYQSITGDIFRRFVTLKEPDVRNGFFDDWSRKVEPCKKDLQTIFQIGNDINYRVYESWDSVRMYHHSGIADLKKDISKNS